MIRKAMAILSLYLMSASAALAHGPLHVAGGDAVVWQNLPVIYTVDLGTLGIYSNEQAADMIARSFASWMEESTTRFAAASGGYLPWMSPRRITLST